MTDRPNRGAYPKRWRKGVAPLPPGIWPESTIHTHEAAQILGVDVRTIERLRARGMGPVQIASGIYHGRAIRYVVWELIVWRNKIIGEDLQLTIPSGPGGWKQERTWRDLVQSLHPSRRARPRASNNATPIAA